MIESKRRLYCFTSARFSCLAVNYGSFVCINFLFSDLLFVFVVVVVAPFFLWCFCFYWNVLEHIPKLMPLIKLTYRSAIILASKIATFNFNLKHFIFRIGFFGHIFNCLFSSCWSFILLFSIKKGQTRKENTLIQDKIEVQAREQWEGPKKKGERKVKR